MQPFTAEDIRALVAEARDCLERFGDSGDDAHATYTIAAAQTAVAMSLAAILDRLSGPIKVGPVEVTGELKTE